MSKSCIFDKCCGCIELRTGCLIIGYLNLIGAILGVVAAVAASIVGGVAANSDEFKKNLKDHGVTTIALVIAIILIIMLIFFFTMCIVYLVGIHQNKKGHVKAYLIFASIFLVIYTVMFFVSFASPPVEVSNVCSMIFNILLNVYFLLVIRSYYYKMDDGSRQPAIYNTA